MKELTNYKLIVRLFIWFVFSNIFFIATAQYKPLLNNKSVWYINYPGLGYEDYIDHYIIDTIEINGFSYSQFKQAMYYVGVYPLREDSLTKKVFSLNLQDSTETLLYDFNLEPGDTFFLHSDTFLVTSVDSISDSLTIQLCAELDSSYDNFITLINLSDNNRDYLWIEGIGSLSGLAPWRSYYNLSCYYRDMDNLDFFSNCYNNSDGICLNGFNPNGLMRLQKDKLNIYPNPTNDLIHVLLDNLRDATLSVRLRDINSGLVNITIEQLNNELIIDVSNLNIGIYFLEILDSSGKTYANKIVKM